ncbi:MAG: ATP-binding cassette domain-containing protein [Candidatus Thorarchaeota archaeon]|jgi:peptide/nickel transport system ATP-binding protein
MTGEVSNRLLDISNLNVYETKQGNVQAVRDLTLSVDCGEFVGISGESGCGKTTTAMTIMQLLPREGIIESGSIRFNNRETLEFTEAEILDFRWKGLSMIFQGSMNALNPVHGRCN